LKRIKATDRKWFENREKPDGQHYGIVGKGRKWLFDLIIKIVFNWLV
jgi:hypothetical protein